MIRTVILAALALVCAASNAEARQRHRTYLARPDCNVTMPCEGVAPSPRGEKIAKAVGFGVAQKVYTPRAAARGRAGHASAAIVAHPAGCPSRAFCGCGAAVRVFGAPIRSLWLAANGSNSLGPRHRPAWSRFAGIMCSCSRRISVATLGRFTTPIPATSDPHPCPVDRGLCDRQSTGRLGMKLIGWVCLFHGGAAVLVLALAMAVGLL